MLHRMARRCGAGRPTSPTRGSPMRAKRWSGRWWVLPGSSGVERGCGWGRLRLHSVRSTAAHLHAAPICCLLSVASVPRLRLPPALAPPASLPPQCKPQERFKGLERELKIKQFSSEGLKRDSTDPVRGARPQKGRHRLPLAPQPRCRRAPRLPQPFLPLGCCTTAAALSLPPFPPPPGHDGQG